MTREWQTPNGKIIAEPAVGITLGAVEAYLDAGKLYTETRKGTLWQIRRNGQTKTWKREPGRFEIPVKAGFRECFRIDNRLSHLWVRNDI